MSNLEAMSATLPELSPIPLPEEKPSNRGKFSLDRNYWEQLHHNRYTKWQLGTSAEDIASEEGVSSNAIRHSLAWVEARLTGAQVVEGRNTRLRLRTFAQLSEKYVEELEKLMGDANPIIRSRALEHFRKTLGLEANSGVRVNIHNQQAAVFGQQQPQSFEEAMDRIRELYLRADVTPPAVPLTGGSRSQH